MKKSDIHTTLPITNEYRLAADSICWMLQEQVTPATGKYAGVPRWKSVSWFNTLEHALRHVHARLVRESQATNFTELVVAAERIAANLNNVLEVHRDNIQKIDSPDLNKALWL